MFIDTACEDVFEAHFFLLFMYQVVFTQEFLDLVIGDASMIQKREETDTIQIIDDIRHHLLKLALPGMNSSNYDIDTNVRFELLDRALKTLGLDA